jgi:phage tail sheath protein FI
MPELTYSSAGVGTREIDLSQPSRLGPQGTPACVIGSASRGPAFVPVTVGDFKEFVAQFGESDGEKFAPLAVNEWLKNAQSLTFVRTLGVGDGKGSVDSTAGFVVGAALPEPDNAGLITAGEDGVVKKNKYSTGTVTGTTHLISAYMTDTSGSAVLADAGITETIYTPLTTSFASSTTTGLTLDSALNADTITWTPTDGTLQTSTFDGTAWSVVTGYTVTVTPPSSAGVITSIVITDTSGATEELNTIVPTHTKATGPVVTPLTAFTDGVDSTCALVTRAMVMIPYGVTMSVTGYIPAARTSVMTLNTFAPSGDALTAVTTTFTFSLDPTNAYYIANVLNTDPLLVEEKGHLLYTHYEIDENQAAVAPVGATLTEMIVTEDAGDADDAYKTFEQRFNHAKTPWVKSQSFGTDKFNLFKIHALSDGEFENSNIKISVINLRYDKNGSWGSFDLVVRDFNDTDAGQKHIERFSSLNLDPTSSNFIAKKIGDKRTWFNFDKQTQQLQTSGTYDNVSKYIRVEISDDVSQSQIPVNAVPFGHAAYEEMTVTLKNDSDMVILGEGTIDLTDVTANNLPLPYRQNVAVGLDLTKKSYSKLHWGFQMSKVQDIDEPNESFVQSTVAKNLVKFLPNGTLNSIVATTGHEFTLENVEANVRDLSTDADERAIDWKESNYRYDSVLDDLTTVTRALKASDITGSTNSAYAKFTMLMQGGFDGTNIFREQKAKMQNAAVVWEMEDASNQGGTSGPTVVAYRKALDVITSKSDVEIQILAVPGIRHSAVTQYAIDAVESRFDALYIADILEKDSNGDTILSETQITDVGNTIAQFVSEGYDSSFGAAYFPDVIMTDPITKTQMKVPPSVAVLGAMALNDAIAHPWYAPAGFTRGALKTVEDTSASFSRANLDALYNAKINPLTSFPGTEVVIWGQKTMLQAASALDRVNVRRLLIAIRRAVKNIALSFLFEPNRVETLAAFESRVNPLLQSIQEKSGLDRYKVKIDTETTTQMDVENNTLRGKIYIQPTKTAEFISLDFVVSNTL